MPWALSLGGGPTSWRSPQHPPGLGRLAQGDIDHPADAIYVRSMDPAEVTPRVKAAAQA